MEPCPEKIALAKKLCNHLTEYEPDEENCVGFNATIKHKSGDGRRICVRSRHYGAKGKYECHVSWPRYESTYYKPENSVSSIKVSEDRGVEVLAKEITRRLIPDYNEQHAEQLAKIQKWVDRDKKVKSLRNHVICDLLGGTISDYESNREEITCYRYGLNKIRFGEDKIQIHTDSLPKEVGLMVLEVLKNSMPERSY